MSLAQEVTEQLRKLQIENNENKRAAEQASKERAVSEHKFKRSQLLDSYGDTITIYTYY